MRKKGGDRMDRRQQAQIRRWRTLEKRARELKQWGAAALFKQKAEVLGKGRKVP